MVIRELITKLGFDVDEAGIRRFNSVVGEAKQKAQALVGQVSEFGRGMRNFGIKATAAITLPVALFSRSAIKMASDAEEVENKFRATFSALADEADKWADKFGETVGRSEIEIRDNLSALQAFAVGLGFSNKEAMKMSTTLETLSVDFASFNNLTDQEAIQRFISAMSGSGEVLDRFGINIKQAALDIKLLEMGFKKSAQGATEAQKAQARLLIIQEAMGRQGAIGDAVRTAGSYANSLKRLKRETDELLKTWGNILLPVAAKVVRAFIKIARWFNNLSERWKKIITITAVLAAAVGPLLIVFGSLIMLVAGLITKFIILQAVFAAFGTAIIAGAKVFALFFLKFALWAALIASVIALIALLFDDIRSWTKGEKSLTGILLGPWEAFRDGLREIRNSINTILDSLFNGDMEAFSKQMELWGETWEKVLNDFLENFRWVFGDQIIDALQGFWDFVVRMTKAVGESLGVLFTSPKQYIQEWKDLLGDAFDVKLNKTGKKIAGFIGDLGETFGFSRPEGQPAFSAPASISPRQMEQSVVNNRRASQSLVVKSNVNLNFPQGTPEEQMSLVENEARRVFRDEMSRQINQSLIANPMDE